MATTKITKEKKAKVAKEVKVKNTGLVLGARITEKAAKASEKNVYTFNVATTANKTEIKKEIIALYKVTPIKINITKRNSKPVFIRGRKGVKQGGKKAVVFLKKGDKITLAS